MSYLSKIERGKGNPDQTILKQLYARLGIVYETDDDFLRESRQQVREYFYRNLYELEKKEIYRELKRCENRLLYSPLAVDWLLIAGIEGEKNLELLGELTDHMTRNQLAYFYVLKADAEGDMGKKLQYSEKAAALMENSLGYRNLLKTYFEMGSYSEIHCMENRYVALALEEGNTFALAYYYFLNASAYACVNMEDMMAAYYKKAERLLMNTGWKDAFISIIYYNMGAVYVTLEKYELALSCLEKVSPEKFPFLLWHKKGLAYLGLSDQDGAAYCLEKMRTFLEEEEWGMAEGETVLQKRSDYVEALMYEELSMRSKPNYREMPQYLEILEQLIAALKKERTFGFLYAYRNVVREVYVSQRKYRKALEFELELSSKIRKNTF